jgi:hypothetical protein
MGYVHLLRSGVVPELLKSSRLFVGSASGVLENVPAALRHGENWSPDDAGVSWLGTAARRPGFISPAELFEVARC